MNATNAIHSLHGKAIYIPISTWGRNFNVGYVTTRQRTKAISPNTSSQFTKARNTTVRYVTTRQLRRAISQHTRNQSTKERNTTVVYVTTGNYEEPSHQTPSLSAHGSEIPMQQMQFTVRKDHLTTHLQSVHMGKKHPCNLCSYNATEKGNLKRNQDRMHKNNEVLT